MGLSQHSVRFLMREGRLRPFKGKLITLGKQDVWVTFAQLKQLARTCDYPLRPLPQVELSHKPEMAAKGFLSDRSLLLMLGFEEVVSVDASNYENADIQFDLNQDQVHPDLFEKGDLVLDPGTIEHVFHVPNSLKNIFQMLKVGGRIIHIAPSSNHMDHGFYMFSPTLFWDYYHANRFDVHLMEIIKYKPQPIFPWKIASYIPGKFNLFSYGGLDNQMYAIACIATKQSDSSFHVIPQQFNYSQNLWKSAHSPSKNSRIKEMIKKSGILYVGAVLIHRIVKEVKLRWMFRKQKSADSF